MIQVLIDRQLTLRHDLFIKNLEGGHAASRRPTIALVLTKNPEGTIPGMCKRRLGEFGDNQRA